MKAKATFNRCVEFQLDNGVIVEMKVIGPEETAKVKRDIIILGLQEAGVTIIKEEPVEA